MWPRQAVCARLAYELYRHRHTDTHTTHRRERDKQPEPGGSQQAEGKLFEPTQRYPPPSSRSDRFYNIEVFVSGFLPPSLLGKWCNFFVPNPLGRLCRAYEDVCVYVCVLFCLICFLCSMGTLVFCIICSDAGWFVMCLGFLFFCCFCSFPVYRFPWEISNSSFPRSSPFFLSLARVA